MAFNAPVMERLDGIRKALVSQGMAGQTLRTLLKVRSVKYLSVSFSVKFSHHISDLVREPYPIQLGNYRVKLILL
jgi:hypothetical protein